jgi:hypothetical protein
MSWPFPSSPGCCHRPTRLWGTSLFLLACTEPVPVIDTWGFETSVAPGLVVQKPDTAKPAVVSISEWELPPSLVSDIGPVAAVEPDLLAIAARTICTVSLVNPAARQIHWTTGRCGEGPNEFRVITAIASRGDTILVFDNSLRRITQMSLDGEVLRTTSYGSELDGMTPRSWFGLSTGWGVSLSRLQERFISDRRAGHLLHLPAAAGNLPRVGHPPAFQEIPGAFELGYPACVIDPVNPTIAVANLWIDQVLIVSPASVTSVRIGDSSVTPELVRKPDSDRDVIPAVVGLEVVCGRSTFGVSYVHASARDGRPSSATHAVFDEHGALLHKLVTSDDRLLGTAVRVDEQGLILRNNNDLDGPRLVTVELQ